MSSINNISDSATSSLQQIIDKHTTVFQIGLEELKAHKVHFSVDLTVQSVFSIVSFALRDNVNVVKLRVFRPITHDHWAAPLVPAFSSDKHSICQYLTTIKSTSIALERANQYNMPSADGIFARLAEKRLFPKMDL